MRCALSSVYDSHPPAENNLSYGVVPRHLYHSVVGRLARGGAEMPPGKPRVGQLYSPYDQWRMHGGSQQHMLPEKDGRITLIRFHPGRRNPGAPHILTMAINTGWRRGWRCSLGKMRPFPSTSSLITIPGNILVTPESPTSRMILRKPPSAAKCAAGPSGTSCGWNMQARSASSKSSHLR